MKINQLLLNNFRNYENLDISFNDGLNIIIGNNAQGKTNILEAIYYLSITKSFFNINDKNVINKNAKYALVIGNINNNGMKKKLSILLNNDGKKIEINNKEIKKHINYIGNLKVILFSPDNVRLIKDSPINRRKFLNIEISQLFVKYIRLLSDFNSLLKQRNEYLKNIKINGCNKEYFEIINEKFSILSVDITLYRDNFINKINEYIGKIFLNISGIDNLFIKYMSNIETDSREIMKENFLIKLNNNYNREVIYGTTLYGPHRDDFNFYLNNDNLSLYGSQGQLKMAVLALKLAEIFVFKDLCGDNPILLLDDVFSELDINRRNMLIKYINNDVQTIITTTDLNNINKEIYKNSYIFRVENGNIIEKIINDGEKGT